MAGTLRGSGGGTVRVLVAPVAVVVWASVTVVGLLVRLALVRSQRSPGRSAVAWGCGFAVYLWAGARVLGVPEARAIPFAVASLATIALFVYLRGAALEDAPVGRPDAAYRRLIARWRTIRSGIDTSSPAEAEAAEQRRWLTWFAPPALIAAAALGLTFATGQLWYLAVVFAAFVIDVGALIWLGLTTDHDASLR